MDLLKIDQTRSSYARQFVRKINMCEILLSIANSLNSIKGVRIGNEYLMFLVGATCTIRTPYLRAHYRVKL